MLNIYNIETSNYVNGHGNRFVIWVQGCDLACEGCWNQQTWNFENKHLMTTDELFEQILEHMDDLDGVTFTGGEPFLQSEKLTEVAKKIKEQTTLTLQVFSGFNLDEIERDRQKKKLLDYIDTLICGRYDNNMVDNNQTLHVFNEDVTRWIYNNSDVEIDIDEENNIKITGYPTDSLINNIKDSNAGV